MTPDGPPGPPWPLAITTSDRVDPALAERQLGFRAEKDLKTMCRDLWNWQTKNPWGYGEPEGELAPRARRVAEKLSSETNGVPIKS